MNTLNLLDSIIGFDNAYNIINNQMMKKILETDHSKSESQNIYVDHLLILKNISNFSKIKHFETNSSVQSKSINPSTDKINHQRKHTKVLDLLPANLVSNMEKARLSLWVSWTKGVEKKTFCHKDLENYLTHFKQYCENINIVYKSKNNYDALLNFHHPRFSCESTEETFKKISGPLKTQYSKFKEFFKTIKTIKIDSFLTKDTDYKDILREIKTSFNLHHEHGINYVKNNLTIFHDSKLSKSKSNDEFQNSIINDLTTDIQNELNSHFFNKPGIFEDYNSKLLSMTISYFFSFHLSKSQQYINHLSEIIKKIVKGKNRIADTQNLYWLFNRQGDGNLVNSSDDISKIFFHMLQYVIERDLINGTIKAADLPEVWIEGIRHYFGIDVKPEHVLQNTYMGMGKFGNCVFKINSIINSAMIFSQYEKQCKGKPFNPNIIKQFFNNLSTLDNTDYTSYSMLDKTLDNVDVYMGLLKNRIL